MRSSVAVILGVLGIAVAFGGGCGIADTSDSETHFWAVCREYCAEENCGPGVTDSGGLVLRLKSNDLFA
jgi:hypothetical protein